MQKHDLSKSSLDIGCNVDISRIDNENLWSFPSGMHHISQDEQLKELFIRMKQKVWAQNILFSTDAILCNNDNQAKHGGPGSDIIVSKKSLTVTFAFYKKWMLVPQKCIILFHN